jgi:hypothetical protein
MNGIIIITLCNIYTSVCLSQPINEFSVAYEDCPAITNEFNQTSRKNKIVDGIVSVASCVPENEFPKEYFYKTTASNQ